MGLIDYIDPIKTTKAILRDWNDQHWKAEYGQEQIEAVIARLTSASGTSSSVPVKGGGTSTEDKMIAGIDKMTVLEHGYTQAKDYVDDLKPKWERLTEDEKYLLVARFIDRDENNGINRIMSRYYISKSEAYRRSDAALQRLSKLLFW